MKRRGHSFRVSAAALVAAAASGAWGQITPDEPKSCSSCDQWNQPQEPFRVFGNTYYVGTTELSAILVQTTDGLILLDAALPQSALLIDENIRALGSDTTDLRLILASHTLNPVSADEFRFTGGSANPSIVDSFRRSIRIVEALPCDILLAPHPGFIGLSSKLRRLRDGDTEAFIDPSACRAYASAADDSLSQRVQNESGTPTNAAD